MHCVSVLSPFTYTYFNRMRPSSTTGHGGEPLIYDSVVISKPSLPLHTRHTLCLLSHRVSDESTAPRAPQPTHHHLITSSTWWAHSSVLPLFFSFNFIYIFIHFIPALRVTVFNIIAETWLLPLNAKITGTFFLSSSPLRFSRVAPRGRNIFISPCAPSFKTFTPAVWKIFLIFLPHGVEKSP